MEGQGIKVFEELKSLVGIWEGKTEAGRLLKVAYRLVAADTVLVETWCSERCEYRHGLAHCPRRAVASVIIIWRFSGARALSETAARSASR